MNPERFYKFATHVTAVAFSKNNPQLLAIGFYDSTVRIINIAINDDSSLVAINQRKTSLPIEPIWQMKWINSKFQAFQ